MLKMSRKLKEILAVFICISMVSINTMPCIADTFDDIETETTNVYFDTEASYSETDFFEDEDEEVIEEEMVTEDVAVEPEEDLPIVEIEDICDENTASDSEINVEEIDEVEVEVATDSEVILDEETSTPSEVIEDIELSFAELPNFKASASTPHVYHTSDFLGSSHPTLTPQAGSPITVITFKKGGTKPSGTKTRSVSTYDESGTYMDGTHCTYWVENPNDIIQLTPYFFRFMLQLRSIEGLNLVETTEMTDMSFLFCACPKLSDIDLSNFDTSNVTTMDYMFDGCESVAELDLTTFDSSSLTSARLMFCSCWFLTKIYATSAFDLTNVDKHQMFFNMSNGNLTGGNGTRLISTDDVINGAWARLDNPPTEPGLFTDKSSVPSNIGIVIFSGNGYLGAYPVTATIGETVKRPDASKYDLIGYTFDNWYKEPECITLWDFDNDIITGPKTFIYAKWIPNTYTISYDLNGGTALTTFPTSRKYNELVILPDASAVSFTGHRFKGWYEISNPGTILTKIQPSTSRDMHLRASWESIVVTSIHTTSYTSSNSGGGGGGGGGRTKSSIPATGLNPLQTQTTVLTVTDVHNNNGAGKVFDSNNSAFRYDPLTNKFKLEIKGENGQMLTATNGFYNVKTYIYQSINGVDVPIETNSTYCFDQFGNMCTGWVVVNNDKYYFDTDTQTIGRGLVNTQKLIDGILCTFGADGKLIV